MQAHQVGLVPALREPAVSRRMAELMWVKNFGQTSLEEIDIKLGDFSLGLRKLD